MNYLYFLAGLVIGTLVIVYTRQIVGLVGRMDLAERYLGPTGTFSAWKIIGVLCILAGFLALRYA